jgi:HlyD family secretion protein
MDTVLAPEIRKKQKVRKTGKIVLLAAGLSFLVFLLYYFLSPSIKASEIITAATERGRLEASLTASGTVVPPYEQVISSPILSRIEAVIKNEGDPVKAGDPILTLDKEFTLLAYEKMKDEQAIKNNKVLQLEISMEKEINELQSQLAIQRLKVESYNSLYEDEVALKRIGGTTEDKLKQAELNLKIAIQEKELLDKRIGNKKDDMKASMRALALEISIQDKNIKELETKIEQAEIKAQKDGVATFVNGNIGSTVQSGEIVAKIADLSSFSIEATISDAYANHLKIGNPVKIRIKDEDLEGQIRQILPNVANGLITFMVQPENPGHPALRPNLRVDVFVITAFKENVIRLSNGPFYKGQTEMKVFVVQDENAIAKKVQIGESNFDYVELVSGLKEGEKVIISDMEDYQHLDQIDIKY